MWERPILGTVRNASVWVTTRSSVTIRSVLVSLEMKLSSMEVSSIFISRQRYIGIIK